MNNPNRAHQALTHMRQLAPDIPTAQDLIYGPPQTGTGPANPDPGKLPHGLDRVTDDWETGTIRSWYGVNEYLWDVADEWAELLQVRAPIVLAAVDWLQQHVYDAAQVADEETWDTTTRIITRAYRQVLRLTGREPIPAGMSCPSCGHALTRDATSTGAGDLLNCRDCRRSWTPREYIDALMALANDPTQLPPDFPVTVAQAARLWSVPYKTAYGRLRVRRDRGEPTGKHRDHGRTLYHLTVFRPLESKIDSPQVK